MGVTALLIGVFMFKMFGSTTPQEQDATGLPPRAAAHPHEGLTFDDAQRARAAGGGWIADSNNGGGTGHEDAAAAARRDSASSDDESAGRAGGPGSNAAAHGAPTIAGASAQRSAGGMGATGNGSLAAAAPLIAGGQPPVEPAAAVKNPARNGATGAEPAPPSGEAPPLDLVQPPGGDTIHYPGVYDLPTDSVLPLKAAQFFGPDTGALSFWLQPKWAADDPTTANLVQLGNVDQAASLFSISKDGQSLHFNFADSEGGGLDANAPINDWQPGDRHLITATWGQPGPDGQRQASFYVDGTLVGQQAYGGTFELGPDSTLRIGTDNRNGTAVPGIFSNFNVYKQALEGSAQPAAPVAASK